MLPRLTVRIRHLSSGGTSVRSYYVSPVTVGHGAACTIRLDADVAERHHAAFLFGGSGVEFVAFGAAAATTVDGLPLATDQPVAVFDATAIGIGPFEIRVELSRVDFASGLFHLGPAPEPANDRPPLPATRDDETSDHSPASMPALVFRHGPLALLTRALQLVEILACAITEARMPERASLSPLNATDDPEEIITYLIDPQGGNDRLDELLVVLGGLIGRVSARGKDDWIS